MFAARWFGIFDTGMPRPIALMCLGSAVWLLTILQLSIGSIFVSLGVFCNSLVVFLNDGMPVVPALVNTTTHHSSTSQTILPWLGDRFSSIPIAGVECWFSIGDVLVCSGFFVLALQLLRTTPADQA